MNNKNIKSFLKADIQKYFIRQKKSLNPSISGKLKVIWENYGLHAIFVYRFGNYIETKFKGKHLIKLIMLGVYNFLNFLVVKMYDIKIDRKASIGKGLYIAHFGGIKISKCVIGQNISLHQRVHIEGNDTRLDNNMCQIGDNVWIGPHAIIKNGIKIGDDATIAAGAVVENDVESNCLAIGNPARILKKKLQ